LKCLQQVGDDALTQPEASLILAVVVTRSKRNSTQARALSLPGRIALLSAKRQATIQPALERPRKSVLLSVRGAATKLKTDPATMIRMVRGVHFKSYREFQLYLQELSKSSQSHRRLRWTPANRGFALCALCALCRAARVVQYHCASMRQLAACAPLVLLKKVQKSRSAGSAGRGPRTNV
jgi:hypothetical protein